MTRLIKLWIGVVIIASYGVGRVNASDRENYYLSPSFEKVEIEQGQSQVSWQIEVGNNSHISQTFNLSVIDFGSLDEAGGVAFLTSNEGLGQRKYSLASWITLEKDRLEIGANQKERVKVTVRNRDSLAPGGHYGAVLVNLSSELNDKSDQVNLVQTYASLIFLKKEGDIHQEMDLVKWDLKRSWWRMPDNINLKFQNIGNVH